MVKAIALLVLLGLALHSGWCIAQQCRSSDTEATDERFQPLPGGQIVDQQSHLVWMRCSVGQRWDSSKNTCTGEALLLTWFQANELLSKPEYKAHRWRLPGIYELSSITELNCYDPAIKLQHFPHTPASHYWTATAFANKAGYYWLVQFLNGENHTDRDRRLAFVRMVKPLP